MNIALTGGSGLLGSEIGSLAVKYGHAIVKVNRDLVRPDLGMENVLQYIESLGCQFLIHCAANTDVEYCELNKHTCFKDNILLSEVIANACKQLDIKLVFISSTGIYGDYKSEPFCEYDAVQPTTVHHRSKYLAENISQKILSDVLIIRTGWLFGGTITSTKNFVANRIREAKNSKGNIESDALQVGNPTYVGDVAERILLLLQDNVTGVYNCVNSGIASRYEYVTKIIEFSDLDIKVNASKKKFYRVAPVSFNESAINFKMDALSYPALPHWKVRLLEYINTFV